MSFIDWIKNRNAAPQQAVAEKSQTKRQETAKEMYTRQDAEEKANRLMPTADQKALAKQIGQEMRQATQETTSPAVAQANVPGGGGTIAAQRDRQNQGKTQAALSPTDGTASQGPSQEKPKAPEKSPQRTPTIARRPPSWER